MSGNSARLSVLVGDAGEIIAAAYVPGVDAEATGDGWVPTGVLARPGATLREIALADDVDVEELFRSLPGHVVVDGDDGPRLLRTSGPTATG